MLRSLAREIITGSSGGSVDAAKEKEVVARICIQWRLEKGYTGVFSSQSEEHIEKMFSFMFRDFGMGKYYMKTKSKRDLHRILDNVHKLVNLTNVNTNKVLVLRGEKKDQKDENNDKEVNIHDNNYNDNNYNDNEEQEDVDSVDDNMLNDKLVFDYFLEQYDPLKVCELDLVVAGVFSTYIFGDF